MLYLLESPLDSQQLADLAQQATPSDDLVFLNDGVYCQAHMPDCRASMHLLADHAQLRGVDMGKATAITLDDLVALTAKHPTSITR